MSKKHKKVPNSKPIVPATTTPPATTPPATTPPKAEDVTPYRNTAGLTTLFVYGPLNVHDVQRKVWGEAKEGRAVTLADFELKEWADSSVTYVERKIGETVVGKAYDLTDEELKATDEFESDMYVRETIDMPKRDCDVYIRNPEVPGTTKVAVN